MADFEVTQFGSLVFPLDDQPTGTDLLEVCDPALAKLRDYLVFSINRKIGTALTGATGGTNPPIGANIRKTLWVDPLTNVAKAEQVAFPLFCLWHVDSKMSNRTLNWRQDIQEVGFSYSLPAMTLEQALKFSPILKAVVEAINASLHQGFDPAYNNGERIINGNDIASAKCVEVKYGSLHVGDLTETHFQSVFGKLEVIEQTMPNLTGLTPLAGTDVTATQQAINTDAPYTLVAAKTEVG